MKTKLKSLASLLAIAAIILISNHAKAENIDFTIEDEEELVIENWMTAQNFGFDNNRLHRDFNHMNHFRDLRAFINNTHRPSAEDIHQMISAFNRSGFRDFTKHFRVEKEQDISLESWMTDTSQWDNLATASTIFKTETEEELSIESWMTEDYFWTNLFANFEPETDSELSLETWMIDRNIW